MAFGYADGRLKRDVQMDKCAIGVNLSDPVTKCERYVGRILTKDVGNRAEKVLRCANKRHVFQ